MKEGLYFGEEHEHSELPLHGKNLWPSGKEHTNLKELVIKYMNEMSQLGATLMKIVASGLELPKNYFAQRFSDSPTKLFRIFNYPPSQENNQEEWGVQEHTDMGFLTILMQDDCGGLEIKTREGQWLQAPPKENTFVINIGDMLEVWTRGIYQATPHRVKNPANKNRLSFPFFYDPGWHSSLQPIEEKLLPQKILQKVPKSTTRKWDNLNLRQLSQEKTYGEFVWEKVRKVFPQLEKN